MVSTDSMKKRCKLLPRLWGVGGTQRTLQAQVRQARMIVGAAAEGRRKFTICFLDWEIIDGSEAALHQSHSIKFPVLVAIGAKPAPAVVMPFIRIAHRD